MSEVRKIISLVDSAYVHMLDAIMDISCNLCLQKICARPEGPRCNVSGMTVHICRYCCLFLLITGSMECSPVCLQWQVERSVPQSASSGRQNRMFSSLPPVAGRTECSPICLQQHVTRDRCQCLLHEPVTWGLSSLRGAPTTHTPTSGFPYATRTTSCSIPSCPCPGSY